MSCCQPLAPRGIPADRSKAPEGVGLIPCQDPPAAVKELERLIQHRQDGIVSAMLPVNVYGINLGDRRFDPIYELAEAAGLPLSVHPQTGHDGQYGVWGTMGRVPSAWRSIATCT